MELYNFSVDGGGIHNWHSIFFNEVVPQYEFDAVIIAIFPGDLSRDFFILNHQEDSTAKYGYFKQKPASRQDFNLTFLPKMEPVGSIMSDRKIDDMILHATDKKTVTGFRPILFYELISIKDRIAFIHNRHNALSDNSQEFELYNYPDLTKLLIESYGKENSSMFLEIMNWCNIQDKEIIISLIPYKNSISLSHSTYIDGIQVEGASIAANFNGHFFDGYQLFQKLTHSEINECFINGDVHWNQTGSDYFANGFSKFLKSLNSKQSNN
ncbi:MAG: hypothetical protein GY751_04220 [Bacteroidetes bacterium]|nr:hypothetical protein [Bacteroidota bacterium]